MSLHEHPVDFPEGAKLGKIAKWVEDLIGEYGRDARLHFDPHHGYMVTRSFDK